jgi:hypothetical protein
MHNPNGLLVWIKLRSTDRGTNQEAKQHSEQGHLASHESLCAFRMVNSTSELLVERPAAA